MFSSAFGLGAVTAWRWLFSSIEKVPIMIL